MNRELFFFQTHAVEFIQKEIMPALETMLTHRTRVTSSGGEGEGRGSGRR